MTAFPFPDSSELNNAAVAVAQRFPAVQEVEGIHGLDNNGGFSGAVLWCVESKRGRFCLRAWPPLPSLVNFLPYMHDLMARARAGGLTFIPTVCWTAEGATFVRQADR